MKKSTATISFMWFWRKVRLDWEGGVRVRAWRLLDFSLMAALGDFVAVHARQADAHENHGRLRGEDGFDRRWAIMHHVHDYMALGSQEESEILCCIHVVIHYQEAQCPSGWDRS